MAGEREGKKKNLKKNEGRKILSHAIEIIHDSTLFAQEKIIGARRENCGKRAFA